MSWDFSTEPGFQKKLDWVEEFCREEVEPLEYVFPYAVRSKDPKIKELVKGLQDQVKDQGLWAIFLDAELGGPGYGQLQLGLLNEILGRYPSAPQLFGAAAPDTGNMEMLAAYGTEEQKKRWLDPLMNQEMFSAYSMTEPQGGSDPNLFRTHATRDGEEWVINGEKWFTSAGRRADILFVMWTAWTIDNSSTQAARTQIAACKYTCAKVLREVTYRALHIMGSLGTTNLTPLQAMWAGAPTMAIADGVDEVHKVTVARNVLKNYEPHDGMWPTEYIPAKREEAKKKFAEILAADAELAAWA